jgi:sulfate permease, SulP family
LPTTIPTGSASPKLGAAIVAGSLSGLVTLTYSVSYAALIFKGSLLDRLDLGIGMALISAIVVAFVVALQSSFRFAIAGPDSNASAILALMASAIVAGASSDEEALSTVVMALALSSLFVGVTLFSIGRLKLGYLVRYIPFPVLGGFLAGTGWLITKGAFSVMTGQSFGFNNLDVLLQWKWQILWLPGLGLAICMMLVMSRFKHYLVFPSLILGGMLLSHLVLWLLGVSMQDAVQQGWLYRPFAREPSPAIWMAISWDSIQWPLIFSQVGNLFAMTGVVVITILLNATGIELSSEHDANLNRELSAAGIANVCSGLLGGIIGYQSISRSLLNFRAGGRIRPSGVAAAAFCVLFFLGASPLLTAIPKLVLGGLLLYLGLGLLKEWVILGWKKLSHTDYAMVMAILLVIAAMGFLEGVAFGLVISVVLVVLSYSQINVVKHVVTGESHRSSFSRPLSHQDYLKKHGQQTLILNLHGYLFFGTSHSLQEQVKAKIEGSATVLKSVILDFRLVTGLDSSITLSFEKILQIAKKNQLRMCITDLKPAMQAYFANAGLALGEKDGFQIFSTLDHCVQWCEDDLLKSGGLDPVPKNANIETVLTEMFLKPYQVQGFMKYLTGIDFRKDEVVCAQGATAKSMYFVASGIVTAQLEVPGGENIRLISMGPGTVFGEMGLYTMTPRSASVITEVDSVLYELSDDDLQLMQREDPDMATGLHRYIIRLMSERIAISNRKVLHLT